MFFIMFSFSKLVVACWFSGLRRFVRDGHDSSAAPASRPLPAVLSPLTFTKRFDWTHHLAGIRSRQVKRLGFSNWKYLTGRIDFQIITPYGVIYLVEFN
jgi:hypothetical protein